MASIKDQKANPHMPKDLLEAKTMQQEYKEELKQKWLREGEKKGKASILLLQLEHRFGMSKQAREKIAAVDIPTLDKWSLRILDAKYLEWVIEDSRVTDELLEIRDMFQEYVEEWEQKWEIKGRMKGRMKGRQEGKASTLLLQLEHRFGDVPNQAREKIAGADIPTLDKWNIRVLDAKSLKRGSRESREEKKLIWRMLYSINKKTNIRRIRHSLTTDQEAHLFQILNSNRKSFTAQGRLRRLPV